VEIFLWSSARDHLIFSTEVDGHDVFLGTGRRQATEMNAGGVIGSTTSHQSSDHLCRQREAAACGQRACVLDQILLRIEILEWLHVPTDRNE
jgi:hypothetical protein